MAWQTAQPYFLAASEAMLRAGPDGRATVRNHLLLGDELRYLGQHQEGWLKVACRGHHGWLPASDVGEQRLLEVNFVDVGQGDGCHLVMPNGESMLIDAGIGEHMHRFLQWRYNLRFREAPPVVAPLCLDRVVISHPDKDHYFGLGPVFEDPKLRVAALYHNGIVERPVTAAERQAELHYYSRDDLGGYLKLARDRSYLVDRVTSDDEMRRLLAAHPTSRKQYLQVLRKALSGSPAVCFRGLCGDDGYLPGYGEGEPLRIRILGPLTEAVEKDGRCYRGLQRLGDEGITKNGHSLVLQLQWGPLRILLGGDLNTQAQDYLLMQYSGEPFKASRLERQIRQWQGRGSRLSAAERQWLAEAEVTLATMIVRGRKHFQSHVAKACHHGSHHFSESFLQVINAMATVVSSGDRESYAHPRPDALGAYGKYGRGHRPLIFSTELARNTREFTPIIHYYERLKQYQAAIDAATSPLRRQRLERQMQRQKDSNVVCYGLITLRSDGRRLILAQKYEQPAKNGRKWDVHQLVHDPVSDQFVFA